MEHSGDGATGFRAQNFAAKTVILFVIYLATVQVRPWDFSS